jgi:hypothetical protein
MKKKSEENHSQISRTIRLNDEKKEKEDKLSKRY